jgi:hypothetical protein
MRRKNVYQNQYVCVVEKKTCMLNTSAGLKPVTSIIHDGFNNYKLHIATPKIKGANNASVQMASYIIHHFII